MRGARGFVISASLIVAACSDSAGSEGIDAPDVLVDAPDATDAYGADAYDPVDAPLVCEDLQEWTWTGENFVSTARDAPPYDFAGGQWFWDVHYAAGAVRSDTTHMREPGTASIRVFVDPSIPVPANADYAAQFRSEIARRPWHEAVPLGTELWLGFSYYMPASYVQDTSSRATVFQLHAGRHHPPIEIAHWVPADYNNAYGTQLHVIRRWGGWNTNTFDRATLPVTFEPNHWYDFVVHVVWDVDGGTRGLTEIWINGTRHYSATGGNTYSVGTDDGDDLLPYGGTPKLGWYKWPWHDAPAVTASATAGVDELEMYIGAVRIMRHAEGAHVGARGYDCVAPRGQRP